MAGAEFKMIIGNKIELSIEVTGYGLSLTVLEPIEKNFYQYISDDELNMLSSLLERRKEIRDDG